MPASSLDGRVALVTGAASGIGAATVATLRDRGARVAACDVDPAVTGGPDGFVLDVTDPESVTDVVATVSRRLGDVDVLINGAGILRPASLTATAPSDWAAVFAVNVTGVFLVTREVARRMIPRRTGNVVTVASNAAAVPRLGMGGYPASKAAAAHLTRCFGLELAEHGIRCNVVAPGSTDTPMFRALSGDDGAAGAVAGDLATHRLGVPLGRIASAAQVAETIAFLASDAADHLTMQELYVDGGASLR